MSLLAILVPSLAVLAALLFVGRARAAWIAAGVVALLAWLAVGVDSPWLFGASALVFGAAVALLGVASLRQRVVTPRLMPRVARMLPRLGDTERIALEAGTVGFEGEFFAGRPDLERFLQKPLASLSARERAFVEGPVEELCAMLDDWDITQRGDLPPEVWRFLREKGFFGMIVPERFGGLEFSAAAHSEVVVKIASRNLTAAVTVMVPNSLGPGELLMHYGTDAQKEHYLPRLARGEEVPCFALTGPEAGSDAAATQCEGIVCHGKWKGEEALGIRLSWNKRYITLAPVATLIGLAFRLRDPEHLIGQEEDLGITCALVPADLPGVEIGRRHDPLGIPFHNGPTTGQDVFVPIHAIIGGREGAGQGWRMLMETLAVGRSISLPAVSVGGAEVAARLVSAYAMVREQFDTPIGRFEGVEEPLARIAGRTYLMDAMRRATTACVDEGEKPAVLSAIAKAYLTELMRKVTADAMDIRAGAAIVRGPRNVLARVHQSVPIGITVEGANILTRSMIIFGQGAIRCHPFVLDEMEACAEQDLARFDGAFFGHVGFVATQAARALLLGLTGGRLASVPEKGALRRPLQELMRWSAAFALVSDVAMATLGGALKRREKITGRLADALAWMVLGACAARRFVVEGRHEGDLPLAQWAGEEASYEIERALRGVIDNLPARPAAWLLRALVFPLGADLRGPDDALGAEAARALLDEHEVRERLTASIYVPPPQESGLGHLEDALRHARRALAVEARIRRAVREGLIDRAPGDALVEKALAAGVIGKEEREWLREADEARSEAIHVDAFEPEEYLRLRR
jgi:acyl-CoA dehydrogenase